MIPSFLAPVGNFFCDSGVLKELGELFLLESSDLLKSTVVQVLNSMDEVDRRRYERFKKIVLSKIRPEEMPATDNEWLIFDLLLLQYFLC